jgi:hypothetical protein
MKILSDNDYFGWFECLTLISVAKDEQKDSFSSLSHRHKPDLLSECIYFLDNFFHCVILTPDSSQLSMVGKHLLDVVNSDQDRNCDYTSSLNSHGKIRIKNRANFMTLLSYVLKRTSLVTLLALMRQGNVHEVAHSANLQRINCSYQESDSTSKTGVQTMEV